MFVLMFITAHQHISETDTRRHDLDQHFSRAGNRL